MSNNSKKSQENSSEHISILLYCGIIIPAVFLCTGLYYLSSSIHTFLQIFLIALYTVCTAKYIHSFSWWLNHLNLVPILFLLIFNNIPLLFVGLGWYFELPLLSLSITLGILCMEACNQPFHLSFVQYLFPSSWYVKGVNPILIRRHVRNLNPKRSYEILKEAMNRAEPGIYVKNLMEPKSLKKRPEFFTTEQIIKSASRESIDQSPSSASDMDVPEGEARYDRLVNSPSQSDYVSDSDSDSDSGLCLASSSKRSDKNEGVLQNKVTAGLRIENPERIDQNQQSRQNQQYRPCSPYNMANG